MSVTSSTDIQTSDITPGKSTRDIIIRVITWIIRLLTGCTFIYSGFVKAIDPWGTVYKFGDYLAAMGLDLWPNLVLAGVFLLFGAEFLIGIFLVSGSFRRTAPLCALAFMCVMLPLTLWVAISNPVSDCGCFGDALVISNWATFWKNCVLTAFAVWLTVYNRGCRCIITPALQWIAFVVSGVFIACIGLIGYEYQPLVDFRAYQEGTPLFEENESEQEESFIFIYEKDGKQKEFGENDELPDENEGWRFVDRKELANSNYNTKSTIQGEKNFRIWDETGDEDLTEDFIEDALPRQLFILMPDLSSVSIASSYKINSLYAWSKKNDIQMSAVVAGSTEQIEAWKDLSMAEYPIYTSDDTVIKEVARGNPAVVYVDNDTIRWKNSLKMLQADDFLNPTISADPMTFFRDNHAILRNFVMLYIGVMAVIIVMSFLPLLKNVYKSRKDSPDPSTTPTTEG